MENKILEKFKVGKVSVGSLSHLKSGVAVEAMGTAGLDYVMLDFEHSPVSVTEVDRYIAAAYAANITPIVRVNEISRNQILSSLDAGAMGVIVPGVETVDQVKKLISYAKFPPLGNRGYCMTRDGQWGFSKVYEGGLDSYMAYSNHKTLLMPQCETVGCLEHIEEITALDGVDGILIGPYDLSIAMGIPGGFDKEEFKEALNRILAACKKHGKIAMMFSGNPEAAKKASEDGFHSVLMGLDILVLINGYRAMLDQSQIDK